MSPLRKHTFQRKAYQEKYRRDHRKKYAAYNRRTYLRKHGVEVEHLSLDAFIVEDQVCEICGGLASQLDHDHKTNKLRGWLCFFCNICLGGLEKKTLSGSGWVEWIERAKEYLSRYSS